MTWRNLQISLALWGIIICLILKTCNPTAAQQITVSPPSLPLAVANGGTGDTGTAWSTYTPTAACATSGTITTDTVSGRTKTIGKTVFFSISINITTLGTCLGNLNLSLQNVAQSNAPIAAYNASAGVTVPATTTAAGSNVTLVFATAPAANTYWVGGTYESQ